MQAEKYVGTGYQRLLTFEVDGGGFSLMSEAVHLNKPLLSIPLEKQFEQVLNALYLEHLGYGLHVDSRTIKEDPGHFKAKVEDFLNKLDSFKDEDLTRLDLRLIAAGRLRRYALRLGLRPRPDLPWDRPLRLGGSTTRPSGLRPRRRLLVSTAEGEDENDDEDDGGDAAED